MDFHSDIWAKGLESPNRAHHLFELTQEDDIAEDEPSVCLAPEKMSCMPNLSKYGNQKGKVVGFGASGCVSLLISNTPKGKVTYAVKEFKRNSKKESKKDYVKRLTSEFCISSCLHHEHVVETFDLVVDSKKHWCEVMEYCSGGTLLQVMQKLGKLSHFDSSCCFRQLIEGVAYIHSMGVCHRDLKPENILFNEHGLLKITDFGISDVFQRACESTPHKSRGVKGTTPYIAPEEFESQEYDGREVDIWASGVIYIAMIHCILPWKLASADDPHYSKFLSTRKKTFYPIDSMEPRCRELIHCVLDPDPKTRYDCAKIMTNSWFLDIQVCKGLACIDGTVHHHIISSNTKQKSDNLKIR